MIADEISWSIGLGRGTPSSPNHIRHRSAMIDPDFGAGPRPLGALRHRVCDWIVSHLPPGEVVGLGLGSCFCSDCCMRFSLGLRYGWCCSCRFPGSPPCIAPAYCVAPCPVLSCLAVWFLSLCHTSWVGATSPTFTQSSTIAEMSAVHTPHCTLSQW
jgi:hypothetical protein